MLQRHFQSLPNSGNTAPDQPLGNLYRIERETELLNFHSGCSLVGVDASNPVTATITLYCPNSTTISAVRTFVPFTVETMHGALVRKLPNLDGAISISAAPDNCILLNSTNGIVNVSTWYNAISRTRACTFVIVHNILLTVVVIS